MMHGTTNIKFLLLFIVFHSSFFIYIYIHIIQFHLYHSVNIYSNW